MPETTTHDDVNDGDVSSEVDIEYRIPKSAARKVADGDVVRFDVVDSTPATPSQITLIPFDEEVNE